MKTKSGSRASAKSKKSAFDALVKFIAERTADPVYTLDTSGAVVLTKSEQKVSQICYSR